MAKIKNALVAVTLTISEYHDCCLQVNLEGLADCSDARAVAISKSVAALAVFIERPQIDLRYHIEVKRITFFLS